MSKHTPAPWNIDTTILTAINAGDKHVAMVNFYNSPTDATRVAGEEHEANARLIAAAPDMLEALKEAQTNFKTYDRFKVDVDAMRKIEAAIAKAEGRS